MSLEYVTWLTTAVTSPHPVKSTDITATQLLHVCSINRSNKNHNSPKAATFH